MAWMELAQNYLDVVIPSFIENLPTLLLFTAAIFFYGFIIYKFYRFVAARDIFGFNLRPFRKDARRGIIAGLFNFILSFIEYGFILPIIAFIWFAGFAILLFVLAKGLPVEQILFIAISIVSATRVASYYNEDLSRDLAKLLPFALLGIAIVDPSFFSIPLIEARIAAIAIFVEKIFVFVLFAILLEWILRVLLSLKRAIFGFSRKDKEEAEKKLNGIEENLAKKSEKNLPRRLNRGKNHDAES